MALELFGSQREQLLPRAASPVKWHFHGALFHSDKWTWVDEIPKMRHVHGAPRDWPYSGRDLPRSYMERFLFKGRNLGVEMVEVGRWDVGSLKYSGHQNRYAGLEYPSGIPNLMAPTLHYGML